MRVRMRHWWSGSHNPYRFMLHAPDTDLTIDKLDLIRALLVEVGAVDGEIVEIEVRRLGLMDTETHWERTEPHHYERIGGPPIPTTTDGLVKSDG